MTKRKARRGDGAASPGGKASFKSLSSRVSSTASDVGNVGAFAGAGSSISRQLLIGLAAALAAVTLAMTYGKFRTF